MNHRQIYDSDTFIIGHGKYVDASADIIVQRRHQAIKAPGIKGARRGAAARARQHNDCGGRLFLQRPGVTSRRSIPSAFIMLFKEGGSAAENEHQVFG